MNATLSQADILAIRAVHQRQEQALTIAAEVAREAGTDDERLISRGSAAYRQIAWSACVRAGIPIAELASLWRTSDEAVLAGIRAAVETTGGPTAATILRSVGSEFAVTIEELKGYSRKANITAARQEAYARLREIGLSLNGIGRIMGRDHATVLHGIRKVRA